MEHNSNEQSERAPSLINTPDKGQLDPPSSKIPRLVSSGKLKLEKLDKGGFRLGRKIASSGPSSRHRGDRPDSASHATEAKFKSHALKFQKELKDINVLKDHLNVSRAAMIRIKEDMLEKQMKDPGPVPSLPVWFLSDSETEIKTEINSLKQENLTLKKRLEEMSAKCIKSTGYLQRIQAEMPKIEEDYQTMMEVMNSAEKKQASIEAHLENFQSEICNIVNNLKNFSHFQENSEILAKQLDNIQNELKVEKEKFLVELSRKENELIQYKNEYDSESRKRQSLETNFMNLNKEKAYLQESCKKFMTQVETLKQMRQLLPDESGAGGTLNHDVIHAQLSAEIESLNMTLVESQRTVQNLSKEKELLIQQISELNKQKEEMHGDLEQTCHQCMFIKENQIYNIKSKMDEIVKLKNAIDSDENDSLFDMDVIMYLSDTESLKNEVVRFHKRWAESLEEKRKAVEVVSAKDFKIFQLEQEISMLSKTVEGLESLVKTLKLKDKENINVINTLQSAVMRRDLTIVNGGQENSNGVASATDNFNLRVPIDEKLLESGDESIYTTRELLNTVEKYKSAIAGMERKLNDLEATHSLCAERRTRNEQRIALLEISLAKYE